MKLANRMFWGTKEKRAEKGKPNFLSDIGRQFMQRSRRWIPLRAHKSHRISHTNWIHSSQPFHASVRSTSVNFSTVAEMRLFFHSIHVGVHRVELQLTDFLNVALICICSDLYLNKHVKKTKENNLAASLLNKKNLPAETRRLECCGGWFGAAHEETYGLTRE